MRYSTRNELLGSSFYELWQDNNEIVQLLQTVYNKGEMEGSFIGKRKDHTFFYAQLSANRIVENNELFGFVISFQDVTESKQIEEQNRTILSTALDGFILTDNFGKIVDVNNAYCRMISYSKNELLTMKISDIEYLENPEDSAKHVQLIVESGCDRFETRHKRKDSSAIDVDVSVNYLPIEDGRFFSFIRDITDRKKAEKQLKMHRDHLEELVKQKTSELEKTYEQLLHSEKLSAIGKLSASIAHEFNNPICGIRNVLENIDDLELGEVMDEDLKRLVSIAIGECGRMAGLVQQLKDFYRPSIGTFTIVKIEEMIDDILFISKKQLSTLNITVEKSYDLTVPQIKVIADQVKQVFLNIINNACDSMPNCGGKLTICTKCEDSKILIEIKDIGVGIPAHQLNSIFEPFFTTKSAVKGTGLGLSICYGIVKNHNGDIKVESQVGKGTIFTIMFPINS